MFNSPPLSSEYCEEVSFCPELEPFVKIMMEPSKNMQLDDEEIR
jgi:hypothetical protein